MEGGVHCGDSVEIALVDVKLMEWGEGGSCGKFGEWR